MKHNLESKEWEVEFFWTSCNYPLKTCIGRTYKKATMGMKMEDDIKRLTAKRKAVLVVEIIHAKTTISEASRVFDIGHPP